MRKRREFDKQQIENIVELYENGYNTNAIGKLYKTGSTTIYRVLIENGVKLRTLEQSRKLTGDHVRATKAEKYGAGWHNTKMTATKTNNSFNNFDRKQELVEYYKNHSTTATAHYFGISRGRVNNILNHLGVELHTKQQNIDFGNAKNKQTKLEKYGDKNYNGKHAEPHNKTELKESNINEIISLYNNGLSLDKIAKKFYISRHRVIKELKDNNVELRDKKQARAIAGKLAADTKQKRYGYRCFNINKAKQTNLEKYGVPYFCMADKCRESGTNDSRPNKDFAELLEQNNIEYQREFHLGNYSYDFKVGNRLIEIDPSATHNSNFCPFGGSPKETNYHQNKSKYAEENGYQCIHIWDWDNLSGVIQLLKQRESVYARKCKIKEVEKTEARYFINEYHIQGYAKDDIRIGLYYNDELVSIMTFGKPRYNKNYQYELVRYCSNKNVTGGAEKLFKYFVKTYNPESIISYCDRSKFDGNTYIKLGFNENNKNLRPSCHWYNMKTGQHITDNLLRQRGFDQLFGTNYGKGTSNQELMLNAGFVEIYDCGQQSYMIKF